MNWILLLGLLPALVSAQCKKLDLPWGSYSAKLDKDGKICVFTNVRFARPPKGPLRFQLPEDPLPSDPLVDMKPISCPNVDTSSPCVPNEVPSLIGDKCPSHDLSSTTFQEDCLFLDIYVPLSVLNGKAKVPVVNWIYGGSYLSGSKQMYDITKFPLYSGQGVLEATSEPAVFVAGNYRLATLGWLAGSTLEKQKGVPNVGLHDQRKTLEFIQKYIDRVNGDKTKVSAWGESAGAGSIMHHLIAKNGKQDPLFQRAILESPAWQWSWDRSGTIDDIYKDFAKLTGCADYDIACLKNVPLPTVMNATNKIFNTKSACEGIYPIGPAVDSTYLTTLPAVAFQTGNFWKNLDSIIVSHMSNEIDPKGSFMPYPLTTNATSANFDKFLKEFMPEDRLRDVRDSINSTDSSSRFGDDQLTRAATLIRDSTFTCNTRQMFDAYNSITKTYMVDNDFFSIFSQHAADLIPTFTNKNIDVGEILQLCQNISKSSPIGDWIGHVFAPAFQSYFISHAIYGNPNQIAQGMAKKTIWKPATTVAGDKHNQLNNVLLPTFTAGNSTANPFTIGQDDINTADTCNFWNGIAKKIMAAFPPSEGGTLDGKTDDSSNTTNSDTSNTTESTSLPSSGSTKLPTGDPELESEPATS